MSTVLELFTEPSHVNRQFCGYRVRIQIDPDEVTLDQIRDFRVGLAVGFNG